MSSHWPSDFPVSRLGTYGHHLVLGFSLCLQTSGFLVSGLSMDWHLNLVSICLTSNRIFPCHISQHSSCFVCVISSRKYSDSFTSHLGMDSLSVIPFSSLSFKPSNLNGLGQFVILYYLESLGLSAVSRQTMLTHASLKLRHTPTCCSAVSFLQLVVMV